MSDLKAKMHQIRFSLGLCHRPRWGAYSAPQTPLLDLREPTSKKRGRKGVWGGEGRGREGRAPLVCLLRMLDPPLDKTTISQSGSTLTKRWTEKWPLQFFISKQKVSILRFFYKVINFYSSIWFLLPHEIIASWKFQFIYRYVHQTLWFTPIMSYMFMYFAQNFIAMSQSLADLWKFIDLRYVSDPLSLIFMNMISESRNISARSRNSSAVLLSYVVRPSVRPSVCDVAVSLAQVGVVRS